MVGRLAGRLVLVLGHDNCGAIDATIKSIKEGTTLRGIRSRLSPRFGGP
jgi:carbonic anhydrase